MPSNKKLGSCIKASIETIIIGGGHISPLEQSEKVLNLIYKLF